MHHGKHYRRFNRTSSHRQHMLRNLTTSLIRYGRIRTTLPKAKELRPIADHVILIDTTL
jgi:ribosomal protein L17